jgi:hypothetical protein
VLDDDSDFLALRDGDTVRVETAAGEQAAFGDFLLRIPAGEIGGS